ncbi:MAG: orotate phosphoribosyltransferase [Planctomycetes bacterium]|nr:orotate phosphoribosyltransferase [Planctomycetota bacterium]
MVHSEQADRALKLLRESQALLEGDFLLSSGRYAQSYVQCAQLLQYPDKAEEVCQILARSIREHTGDGKPFDVVVGPAMGAVTIGYEMARALGVRGVFAERKAEGGFQLRRGFMVEPQERVLIVEDVVTTGGSAKEVLTMLDEMGVKQVSFASLVNRSGVENPFGESPYYPLLALEIPSWDPSELPADHEGLARAVKPGSRPTAT